MESERSGVTRETDEVPGLALGRTLGLVVGIITLILGVIVVARPTQSLVAIAVLLGVVMMVSGVFHLARALGGREHERVWRALSGVVFFLVGLALLRHIDLTVALIGLFIGIAWIIQGVSALVESFSPERERGERRETGWTVFFGIISVIAGIVVVAAPITSVTALTVFMGIWFMVMGILEIIGSLLARRVMRAQGTGEASVPQQRADTAVGERRVQTAQSAQTAPSAQTAQTAQSARSAPRQAASGEDAAGQGTADRTRPTGGNFPA